MKISIIIPGDYPVGAAIDLTRFGVSNTMGIAAESLDGLMRVIYELSEPSEDNIDRIFSLATQMFGVSRERLTSRDRLRDAVDARMAITRALLNYGGMTNVKICKLLRKTRASIRHMIYRWDAVQYYDKEERERLYEFDRQAEIILKND